MRRSSILLLSVFFTSSVSVHAEIIRKECQSEESRGLRYTSQAMYQAAKDSDPWRGCSNGWCQMQSSVADSMTATMRRFEAEGRAALLKARALEAAHCPQLADAIMSLGPATDEEKLAVATEFKQLMDKHYKGLADQKEWQKLHPQCKHVEWFSGISLSTSDGKSGTTPGSMEDLTGNFKGKKGQCSAMADGPIWRGSEDSLEAWDPVTNPRLAESACGEALQRNGLGEGNWSADPKLCQ